MGEEQVNVGVGIHGDASDFERAADDALARLRALAQATKDQNEQERDFTGKTNLANLALQQNARALAESLRQQVATTKATSGLNEVLGDQAKKLGETLAAGEGYRKVLDATAKDAIGTAGAVRKATSEIRDQGTAARIAETETKGYTRGNIEAALAAAGLAEETEKVGKSARETALEQLRLQQVSKDVTEHLALEAIAAHEAGKGIDEKGRKSLEAALGQKVLSAEARETAEQLVQEERAAYRAALGLEATKAASHNLGNGFQQLQRTLVAVAVILGTIAIAPLSAALFDVAAAATAAGAALVPLVGVLPAIASGFGSMAQAMVVLKASQITEVFQSLGQNGDKLKQTLNGLAPPARAFAEELRHALGPLDDLRAKIQGPLFKSLTDALEKAGPAIQVVEGILVDTSKALGDVIDQAGKLIGTKEFQDNLKSFGELNARGIKDLGIALLTMADAFLRVERIAAPLIRFLQDGMVSAAKAIDNYVKDHGRGLAEFFKLTKQTVSEFVDIAVNLGGVLKGIFEGASPLAQVFLANLRDLFGEWSKILNSTKGQQVMHDFFANALPPLHAFLNAVGSLGAALFRLAQVGQGPLARLFTDIQTLVVPILERLAVDLTVHVMPTVLALLESGLKLIKDLIPGIEPLLPVISRLGNMFKGILDFIDGITKGLPGILKLAPALTAFTAAFLAIKGLGLVWTTLGDVIRAKYIAPLQDAIRLQAGLAATSAKNAVGNIVGGQGGSIIIGGKGGEDLTQQGTVGATEAGVGKTVEHSISSNRGVLQYVTGLRLAIGAAVVAGLVGGLSRAISDSGAKNWRDRFANFVGGALNTVTLGALNIPSISEAQKKRLESSAQKISTGTLTFDRHSGFGDLLTQLGHGTKLDLLKPADVALAKQWSQSLGLGKDAVRELNHLLDQEHDKLVAQKQAEASRLAIQKEITREAFKRAQHEGVHPSPDSQDRHVDPNVAKERAQITNLVNHWRTELARLRTIHNTQIQAMVKQIAALPLDAQQSAGQSMFDMATELQKKGKLPRSAVQDLRKALKYDFGIIVQDAGKAGGAAHTSFAKNFAAVLGTVHAVLGGIEGGLKSTLKALGQTKVVSFGLQALEKGTGTGLLGSIAGGIAAAGKALTTKAGGGWVGYNNGGKPAPDRIPIMAAEGEVVLNRHQQRYVNSVMAAAGDGGGIPGVVQNIRQPHYAAGGGYSVHGKMSTFGPPGEGAGPTSSGVSSALPGIALYDGGLRNNHLFRVSQDHTGKSAILKKTDVGPAPWTGRVIDVTGAGVKKMGISNTDSITDTLGTAIDLGFSGKNDPGAPGLASLPGLNVTGPAGMLRSLAQGVANKAGAAANAWLAQFADSAAAGAGEVFGKGQLGMYAFPLPDFGSEQRVDRGQDMQSRQSHSPFTAFGAGIVTSGANDFPGVMYRLTQGPFKGREVFDGHTFSSNVSTGQAVKAGQMLGRVGHQGASYDGDDKHIEIGFYEPTRGGSFGAGEHTQGGLDMHFALHSIAPQYIGARVLNGATGGFPSLHGMLHADTGIFARAAVKHSTKPSKKTVKQHKGKKRQSHPQYGAHFLQALAGTEVPPQLAHITTLANQLTGIDTSYNASVDSTGRSEEQPMVTLSDADAAWFQQHPGELPGVAPNLIANLQSGDQVPNFYGLTAGRFYGFNAAGGPPTIQGGGFIRGVSQRLGEINLLEGNRKGWLKIGNRRYSSISHLIHRLSDKRHGLIRKAQIRLKAVRRRAEANLRHVQFIIGELAKLKGKRLDQQLKEVMSRGAIHSRQGKLRETISGLQRDIAEETDYQNTLPADQRDSTHKDSMQDQLLGLRASLADENSFAQTQSNRLGRIHLAKEQNALQGQLKKYEHEQRRLTGTGTDVLTLGSGGLYGQINSKLSGFASTLTGELNDRSQAGIDISGVKSDIAGFEDERKQYANLFPIMPRDIAASTATGGNATLTDLQTQQNQQLLAQLAAVNSQLGVFRGFSPLLQQRLVGSFAQGTWSVPETGMALVHKGEHISPDPEGPYGSQIVAQRQGAGHTQVDLHFHGESGQLTRLVDARINDKAPTVVSDALGRRTRLIRNAR